LATTGTGHKELSVESKRLELSHSREGLEWQAGARQSDRSADALLSSH
jgi:hypothetical protein